MIDINIFCGLSDNYPTKHDMTQGTETLLQLADQLEESAGNVRASCHLGEAARRMELAVSVVRRFAEFEPDLEVKKGEN